MASDLLSGMANQKMFVDCNRFFSLLKHIYVHNLPPFQLQFWPQFTYANIFASGCTHKLHSFERIAARRMYQGHGEYNVNVHCIQPLSDLWVPYRS